MLNASVVAVCSPRVSRQGGPVVPKMPNANTQQSTTFGRIRSDICLLPARRSNKDGDCKPQKPTATTRKALEAEEQPPHPPRAHVRHGWEVGNLGIYFGNGVEKRPVTKQPSLPLHVGSRHGTPGSTPYTWEHIRHHGRRSMATLWQPRNALLGDASHGRDRSQGRVQVLLYACSCSRATNAWEPTPGRSAHR